MRQSASAVWGRASADSSSTYLSHARAMARDARRRTRWRALLANWCFALRSQVPRAANILALMWRHSASLSLSARMVSVRQCMCHARSARSNVTCERSSSDSLLVTAPVAGTSAQVSSSSGCGTIGGAGVVQAPERARRSCRKLQRAAINSLFCRCVSQRWFCRCVSQRWCWASLPRRRLRVCIPL